MSQHLAFMQQAIELAIHNAKVGGGPFGAVVVKEGLVIAQGVNRVTACNDPTAHAEVIAIRLACEVLGSFQLEGCDIYTSCEPCPMCLGAIYWARPRAVYYACTRQEAAATGFDDEFIYEELAKPLVERKLKMARLEVPGAGESFNIWSASDKKVEY
ncbi:MAG TPA: nucleoside deaminase [Fimbriimonadaceae bacterium]|jgi:guanine deaminase